MAKPARRTWIAVFGVIALLIVSLFAAACAPKATSYTLTFVTNGGTQIDPITAEAGETITPPSDPEKEGAVFDGWYLSADFSGEKVTVPSVMPEENVTYYAKYNEVETATLTLDAGLGSLSTTEYQLEVGTDVYAFVSEIVPVASDNLTFGGWFVGTSDTLLAAGTRLPSAGLSLTARYKVPYTVEVYLQSGAEGDYTLDEDAGVAGGSDFVGATVDISSMLASVTGYTLNVSLTQPIVLSAQEENVFKAYYDLRSYAVYFFGNAPADAAVVGEMENGSALYGEEYTVPQTAFSVEGYRFAGWSTSANGDVAYAPGDTIDVTGVTVLYACWNRGVTDSNGGADILYVLREEENTVLLVRQYLPEQKGTYDEQTRTFWFGENANDDAFPRGRISEDGKTFAYYYEDFDLEYVQYDWADGEIVSGVTLSLDGVDGAVYTDASQTEIHGTYLASGSNYVFTSDDEQTSFTFKLSIQDNEEVFLIRDSFVGTYYWYNAEEGNIGTPVIILDGYGTMMIVADSLDYEAGSYLTESATNGIVEIAYSDFETGLPVTYRVQLLALQADGQVVGGFIYSDALYGEYDFAVSGTRPGQMSVSLNGFGDMSYSFVPEAGGQATEGTAEYVVYGYYTFSDVTYSLFRFELGTDAYLVRVNPEGVAQLLGNETGLYSEYHSQSSYSAQMLLYGDGNAIVYIAVDGSYLPVIAGTYTAVSGQENTYAFEAATYAEGYEEFADSLYSTFTFRTYNGSAFVMSDGHEGERYSFTRKQTDGTDAAFTLTLDGFAMGTLQLAGGTASTTVEYYFMDGYDGYSFLCFVEESVSNALRLSDDADPVYFAGLGSMAGDYYDTLGRIGVDGERLQLFPDGHAIVWVGDVKAAEGSFASSADPEGMFIRYTFTADTVSATEYADYDEFSFAYGTGVLYVYHAGESATHTLFGNSLKLTGYGIAIYGSAQYRYTFQENEADGYTYLLLISSSGSVAARLRYDITAKTLTEPGYEMGSYYSYLYDEESSRYIVGEYILTLDGYNGATLSGLNDTDDAFVTVATGSYTIEGDVYTITWTTQDIEGFSCIMSEVTVSGSDVNIYILGDETLEVSYTVKDGDTVVAVIERDAFDRVTYTEGTQTQSASFRLMTVEEQSLLSLTVYDADGNATAGYVYLIGADGVTLTKTDGLAGVYVLVENGLIVTTSTLSLDGFGNAALSAADGAAVTGTYSAVDGGHNEYIFASDDLTFRFLLTTVSSSDGASYTAYIVYQEKWDAELTSSDWQIISVDGYVSAVLIDFYGRTYSANYTVLGENGTVLHVYGSSVGDRYFRVGSGTFTEITDDFVVDGDELLAYQGKGGNIVIPDGITKIAESVFYLNDTITSVDLNDVTTIGDYAFQATLITSYTGTENVSAIGNYAFYQNIYLASVTFAGVKSVGDYAFARSTALEEVTLGQNLVSVGSNAFAHCAGYQDGTFTLTLLGTTPPQMGENVFERCGTLGVSVGVADLDCVKAYRAAWASYADYVGITPSEEAAVLCGVYYTDLNAAVSAMLALDTQVRLNGEVIGVFTVSGGTVTFMLFDETYSSVTGTVSDKVISVSLQGNAYVFYPAGTERTFTDAQSPEKSLTIALGYGTTTGNYQGADIEIVLGESIYFIFEGERHTLTLDLEENTFTESVTFEAYTVEYLLPFDDYNDNELTITFESADNKSVTLGDTHRFFLIDGRSGSNGRVTASTAGAWEIEWVSADADAQTVTYRITAPYSRRSGGVQQQYLYKILVTVDVSEETLKAGTGSFSYCLEQTVYPETTVSVGDTSVAIVLTAYYSAPTEGSGTGSTERFTLKIGETVADGTIVSAQDDVYTFTVSDGAYAGTYVITFKTTASAGRSVSSIVYTA